MSLLTSLLAPGNATSSAGASGSVVIKAADTSRSNTSTLADDPDLTLAVEAGKTYVFEASIAAAAATTTPDLNFGWAGPAGISGWWDFIMDTTTGTGNGRRLALSEASGRMNVESTAANDYVARVRGVFTTVDAGNFRLQWAQFASGADLSTVLEGSWLEVREVSTSTP